ncbi:hypothetical protein MLD38_033990 [Melastoma candidum]|uniref:Uncharacterized protein n=1 Tax=Melastoma candidum TaxID=119954 RepID=A0ACB9M864_9MYRT|nr:hypothetical protein MLD38_033990 [Melastoma candidum]
MAEFGRSRRCNSHRDPPTATIAVSTARMLNVGDAVEVRSKDDGFLGSWHSATVISCGRCKRKVRYLDVLEDNGRDHLVRSVSVLPSLDGLPADIDLHNYRGLIRPPLPDPPPQCPSSPSTGLLEFSYGLCVDVRYRDAWWEGVIFDVCDGASQRNVFFPDLGDELLVDNGDMRATQDWEEGTGKWRVRGDWLFLQVIEEYEQEWPLAVSMKQIWYDLREKEGFIGLEWTSTDETMWRKLVLETIKENLDVAAVGIIFHLLLPPAGCSGGTLAAQMKSPEMAGSRYVRWSSNEDRIMSLESLTAVQDACGVPVLDGQEAPLMNFGNLDISISNDKGSEDSWHPPNPPLSAGYHPEAIVMFLQEEHRRYFISKVRAHLLFLGWKIEVRRTSKGPIFRYISPSKNLYYSLSTACQELKESQRDFCHPDSEGASYRLTTRGGKFFRAVVVALSRSRLPDLRSCASETRVGDTIMQTKGSISQSPDYGGTVREDIQLSGSSVPKIKPYFNPQAVLEYYAHLRDQICKTRRKLLIYNLRRHLLAVGWKLLFIPGSVRKMVYISSEGRLFNSLSSVCKQFIDDESFDFSTSRAHGMVSVSVCNRLPEFCDQEQKSRKVEPREITGWGNGKPRVNNRCRKRRLTGVNHVISLFNITEKKGLADTLASARIPDKGSDSSVSGLKCEFVGGKELKKFNSLAATDVHFRTWEFRNSIRVSPQIGPSVAHHNPRTVLSWLIDSNVLLPRAKVFYSRELSHGFTAEGRVNREGIKCSCCSILFTLRGFACHADRRHGRTSSCIFLEDGRSLLDCQIQMLRNKRIVGFSNKQYDNIKRKGIGGRSDNICSVCHYGGKLMLCDRCPSAFHEVCLGLEEVPDGDWFCPSCCCCICGQSKIREEHGNILTCDQCKQKFHLHCLNYKGSTRVTRYQKKSWYCSKKCAEISVGLLALSGKPVEVGQGNMTWTLLQPFEIDIDNARASKSDYPIEINSKLNVAVDVIHECFEPVEEFQTRDLIEDVVFSRGSPLGRLNFRGFYTVLLERNDELISVGCVRVHGGDVAEVPLVATRFHYRRQGMCRILMNMLEKKLKELGVQKLILPAVRSVLNTWTQSFKFTRMKAADRLKYLKYSFLDFQDTIMCKKPLIESSPSETVKGILPVDCDGLMVSPDKVELDGSSTFSEVLQVEDEESESVNQDDGVHVSNALPDSSSALPSVGDGLAICSDSKMNLPPLQLDEEPRFKEAIPGLSPANFDEKFEYSVAAPLENYYKRRRKH